MCNFEIFPSDSFYVKQLAQLSAGSCFFTFHFFIENDDKEGKKGDYCETNLV